MRFVKRLTVAAAATLLFTIPGAAQQGPPQGPPPQGQPNQGPPPQGQGRGGMRGPARGAADARMAQRPQLTEQQREQLRTYDAQQRTASDAARRELGDLHAKLDEELTAAQPNGSRVGELRTQIVQRETALAQQRVDRLSKLSGILTA
ncbi:MAG: hypothetical protein M3R55_12720, partial [Acidobacteriota bacterium]|nr:hypothetical protein [Acidobacteriota bacterium]